MTKTVVLPRPVSSPDDRTRSVASNALDMAVQPIFRRSRIPRLVVMIASVLALPANAISLAADECVTQPNDATVERRRFVMGTWLEIDVAAADRRTALAASTAALDAVAAADARLSTWRDDSELAMVNANAARRGVTITPELERDLSQALFWRRETSATFSPGLGALIRVWDLRGKGRIPTRSELSLALANAELDGLVVGGGVIRFTTEPLEIDAGGFGKGAALRDALQAATTAGATCVTLNFGGQIARAGACAPLVVGIADPDDRDRRIADLTLGRGGVATSGQGERFFIINGVRHGHILDPRSGAPAPDWGSVTVVTTDPFAADCLATALYVMGPTHGATWIRARPEIDAVFATRTGGGVLLLATPGLRGRIEPAADVWLQWISTVTDVARGPP